MLLVAVAAGQPPPGGDGGGPAADARPPLTITPYNAGHYVGGSVWRISVGGEDIIYAVDYCHRKERWVRAGPFLIFVFKRGGNHDI